MREGLDQEVTSRIELLAHSAPRDDAEGDPYARHVNAVREGAQERSQAMMHYASNALAAISRSIVAAAVFHDLGKLDPDNQAALRKGRTCKLPWDHIDAGVAHLSACQNWMAAWLVRAHHAPGFPQKQEHFNPDGLGRKLRGRRHDDTSPERHIDQIARTDAILTQLIQTHQSAVCDDQPSPQRPIHGLCARLALSCLVDADHTDAAWFDTSWRSPTPPETRWSERLVALQRYVRALPQGETYTKRIRNLQRTEFFRACLESSIDSSMVACEAPVGLGKTTAVAAYLIRIARDNGLRRLIIVAPYTNILTQTADRLRRALVLSGENPNHVVTEHHHRADFDQPEDRELAVLWRSPIVVTTAVSFFESLAACDPASLRKLHALPGSAVFIDEAHAALPTKLWPQNWAWLRELAEQWGCRFVFASGSLARFWEDAEIVRDSMRIPELLPSEQATAVLAAERSRVHFAQVQDGKVLSVDVLVKLVATSPGPRLVILNTVQNAAVVAKAMKEAGLDVLHLSTALTPRDRRRILSRVVRRLSKNRKNWTLVATSCVEAGVDISFRSAFRERFSVSSTIQTGGRVNRHGEYNIAGGGFVYDFALAGPSITQHPAASISATVLHELMKSDELNRGNPADLVTNAMKSELARLGGIGSDLLWKAEAERNYPAVKKLGRIIDADTRFVVIDPRLRDRIAAYRPVSFRSLLNGSVQLWAAKIQKLALAPLPGRKDIYEWDDDYDRDFLGIMAGVFKNQRFIAEGGAVI